MGCGGFGLLAIQGGAAAMTATDPMGTRRALEHCDKRLREGR
jgi:hypothetical protein